MALTELQLPTKANFFQSLQNAATQMDHLIARWDAMAEFIGRVETGDLDAMVPPVAPGVVRSDLIDFRTALNEVIAFYKGTSTTQTVIPADVIDQIRAISW